MELAPADADLSRQLLETEGIHWIVPAHGLFQVTQLNFADVRAVGRHGSGDVLQFHVVAAAFQIHVAFDVHRADDVALARLHAHVAADAFQAHSGVVAVNVDAAADVRYVEIAIPAVGFDGRTGRDRNIQVGGGLHAIADFVLVGADDNLAVLGDQLERGLLVGAIGVGLLERANGFLAAGLDRGGVRAAGDFGVAAKALDHDAAISGTRL